MRARVGATTGPNGAKSYRTALSHTRACYTTAGYRRNSAATMAGAGHPQAGESDAELECMEVQAPANPLGLADLLVLAASASERSHRHRHQPIHLASQIE